MINWSMPAADDTTYTPPHDAVDPGWDAFTLLALRTSRHEAVGAMRAIIPCWLSEPCDQDAHELLLAEHGEWILLAEPHTELDARVLNAQSAEMIAHLAQLDAVFISHDPDTGALQLHTARAGEPDLYWDDAIDPTLQGGALRFHADGLCTHEEARQFALDALDMPADQGWLDRFAFIEFSLHALGIHDLDPHFARTSAFRTMHVRDLNA